MTDRIMEQKTRYPIGVQSFEIMRSQGYTYVDKTQYIRRLMGAGRCVFLSRPRRFGKSLLLSMLECYFLGKKELFEGLAISNEEHEWENYPVIHIDFSPGTFSEEGSLKKFLLTTLRDVAVDNEVELPDDDDPEYLFLQLIKRISKKTGKLVVLLIDEYDSAIIDAIDDETMRLKNAEILRGFYKVLKPADQYLKFTMLTGVVRVDQLNIFSGLNNLHDITMTPRFAEICGITPQELEDNFREGIELLGQKLGNNYTDTLQLLRKCYNGYRFTEEETTVFNPFSLLNVLDESSLKDYWVKTGTSKIFIKYLKQPDFFLPDTTNKWYSSLQLEETFNSADPVSLMFQTGYLTVADFDGVRNYRLRFPNEEVTRALLEVLIPTYMHSEDKNIGIDIRLTEIRRHLDSGDANALMVQMQSMIGSVPYDDWDKPRKEKNFEVMMYLIFMMLNVDAKCQQHVSGGRIDMVVETKKFVYIFEFKLNGSARKALEQIDKKGYALRWSADGRKVIKIGANFSTIKNTLSSWLISQ